MNIAWRAWDEAFPEALVAQRPVLLVLSASWCHACHRMDDEVWDDPGVAALVERSTVPAKVDADARPDVYSRYHAGGLPSLALLAPGGEFVRGATYLTVSELHVFLDAAVADWRAGRRPGMRGVPVRRAPDDLVDTMVARLVRRADREHGGFGVAPKLPEVEAVTLLLRRWREAREGELERIVRSALDAVIAHLGDPIDGGFFRYAAGADWSGPHTEKLALDQAQIARVLLEAGAALPEQRYVDAAHDALAHARRRLIDAEGRVLASIAADPEYYARAVSASAFQSDPSNEVATPRSDARDARARTADLEEVTKRRVGSGVEGSRLGQDEPDSRRDDVAGRESEVRGAHVNTADAEGASQRCVRPGGERSRLGRGEYVAADVASGVGRGWKLFGAHGDADDRRPPVDTRRFADASAAMLIAAAMGHALGSPAPDARVFGLVPEYRLAAPDGAIPHRLDASDGLRGLLRDQGLGIVAAVTEYRLTGSRDALDWAQRAAVFALAELWDDAEGAFRAEPRAPAPNEITLPPMFPLLANGEIAVALADLADYTGRGEYARVAERIVASLAGRAALYPAGPAIALAAQRLASPPPRADLTGDSTDPAARALARAVVAALGPTTIVRWNGSGAASVTVCARDLCLPSIAKPRELLAALIEVDLAPRDILALWSSGFPHESS